MADKIKSEIVRIDLTDASYKDSHAYIEPTYVNFFFGNNGAGKSTIAKAIKSSTLPGEQHQIICRWYITRISLMRIFAATVI